MPSPLSLQMQILSRCTPEEVHEMIIYLKAVYRIDLSTPIQVILARYGMTLEDMMRINRNYDGWWGLPGTISRFTVDPYWADPQDIPQRY